MNTINGYIEINGVINKVTSIDDLHHIVESLGKEFTEMTKEDYEKLTSKPDKSSTLETDDCKVVYSNNCLVNATIGMEQYKVKEGTKAICSNALYFRDSRYRFIHINKFTFSKTLIAIGKESFRFNNIEIIIFKDNIQFIGEKAFQGCHHLNIQILKLPKSLRYLEADAFESCEKIQSVIFGNEIKEIGSHAFKSCTSLETVYIPNTVECIGSGVFDNCLKLKSIFIPIGTKNKFADFFPFDTEKLVEIEDNNFV